MLELSKTRGMTDVVEPLGGQIPCICSCGNPNWFGAPLVDGDAQSAGQVGNNIEFSLPDISL